MLFLLLLWLLCYVSEPETGTIYTWEHINIGLLIHFSALI